MAQEFHISVTPLGEDEYLVRLEEVAPGVPLAEEQVRWPVEDWLAQARQLMNDPLLGVLQGNPAFIEDIFFSPEWEEPVSQSSLNLVALGQQLYNALFQGSLRDSWIMAQAIAQNQGKVLRLRLGLKGNRLPRLPWEVLHEGDRPLATGIEVAFSRYQLGTERKRLVTKRSSRTNGRSPHESDQTLRILMVIASPSDQETLELSQEANHLKNELSRRPLSNSRRIELDILEQPGREQLTQALEQGQYQVFHYAGHSNLGESGGDLYLVSNKTGLTETLTGDDLAGLLANNNVQMAVFNSCRGAYTATSNALDNRKERNLAEALVKRGIPAVLAMAERIPDEVALTLTRLFYRNLNQDYPIDLSLSRARQGLISAYGSNQLYWALPVLYLYREFDGFLSNGDDTTDHRDELFDLPAPPERLPPARNVETPFIAPARPTSNNFLDMEDELVNGSMAEWLDDDESLADFADDVHGDDLDADDIPAFINNLLSQIDSDPANGVSGRPASETEQRPRAASDARESILSAPSLNDQSSPQQNSSAKKTSAGTTQASNAQNDNFVNSLEADGHKKPGGLKIWGQRLRRVPRLWMLGATGVLAIALLGFWFFQNRAPQPGNLLPESSIPIPGNPKTSSSQNVDLKKAENSKVTGFAIEQLTQGNLATGQKAVEELLNRQALPEASAALKSVPRAQEDNPAILYLKGRLAWEFAQKEDNKDYSATDARRYWETAHKKQPKSSVYLSALGFAYYAEGNYERANQAWLDALYLSESATVKANAAGNTTKKELLNTYAGLALGMRQYAQKQPADKRASLLNKSLKLRQKVMSDDPVNFQPDALSKNWL
ncbi:MAG TPA: CHAT domain-containing protein, partial [Cyanobacteria bacterium UBA8543]|nr:CHAT domain-containing protein [Cyanobacteria bacterium UBA8543]